MPEVEILDCIHKLPHLKSRARQRKYYQRTPSTLTLLSVPNPEESEEEILSRIAIKMDTKSNEEKAVDKADGNSAADLFDLPLIYTLSVLLSL